MVMVLACMAVAAALGLTMLRSATALHGGLRAERSLRQVERLLVAAADLALAQHAAGVPMPAEIRIESAALAGSGSARITLAAEPRVIRIVVEHPLEGPVTVRRSRAVTLPALSAGFPEESLP